MTFLDGVQARVDARERRRRVVSGTALVMLLVAAGAMLSWLAALGALDFASLSTTVLSTLWVAAWGSWASSPKKDRDERLRDAVGLDEGALVIGEGRRALRTEAIDVASSWEREDGSLVLLRKDGRLLVLEGVDEEQRELVQARLRCSVRHSKVALSSYQAAQARGRGCLQPLALLAVICTLAYMPWLYWSAKLPNWTHFGGLAMAAVLSMLWSWRYRRRQVTVGQDGLWVPLRWGSRFVLLQDIVEVSSSALKLSSGEIVELPAQVPGLAERVLDLRQHRAELADAVGLSSLERRGRSVDAWRSGLLGLLGGKSYRETAWSPELLLTVVEDPGRSPEQRIAAAVAASASGDAEVTGRVRIAAQTSADPDLEAALEAAAELELLEAELERSSRRRVASAAGDYGALERG